MDEMKEKYPFEQLQEYLLNKVKGIKVRQVGHFVDEEMYVAGYSSAIMFLNAGLCVILFEVGENPTDADLAEAVQRCIDLAKKVNNESVFPSPTWWEDYIRGFDEAVMDFESYEEEISEYYYQEIWDLEQRKRSDVVIIENPWEDLVELNGDEQ